MFVFRVIMLNMVILIRIQVVIYTVVGLFCGALKGSGLGWSTREQGKRGATPDMVFIHLAVWVWVFF